MKNLLNKILNNKLFLSNNEMFISETDLQLSLAQILKRNSCKKVTLEYQINIDNKNKYVDIYCEYNRVNYFIELKYKTKEIKNKKFTRFGIEFYLKNHNAYTDNRYLIYKDIHRLECLVKQHSNSVGYVLFLTNIDNYGKNHDDMPLQNGERTSNEYKHRGKIYYLNKQYPCEWYNFENCKEFKYLLIEVK